jgi:hypothetical protein
LLRVPTPFACNVARKPRLGVDPAQQRLQVGHDRLDLDHEKSPRHRVECQQVNASALPIARIGHLHLDQPWLRLEPAASPRLKGRVISVEEAVQLAAAPLRVQGQPHLQRSRDAPQHYHGQRSSMTTFELGDQLLADVRRRCKVALSPSTAEAESPDDPAEPRLVHQASVAVADYRRLSLELRDPATNHREREPRSDEPPAEAEHRD